MADKNDTSQKQINALCRKVLPEAVCKKVTQALKDGGIRFPVKPDIVVKPIKNGLKIEYRFGGPKKSKK